MSQNLKIQDVVILAAGKGTRLKNITENLPKALVPVANKPIVLHVLEFLNQLGPLRVHFALGFCGEAIRDFCAKQNLENLSFHFYENDLYDQTNNAYSLHQITKDLNRAFVLIDGDLILDKATLEQALCSEQSQLFCDTRVDRLDEEAMKVLCDSPDSQSITKISKKLSIAGSQGEYIGLLSLQADWATALAKQLHTDMQNKDYWNDYYEDALQRILDSEQSLSPLQLTCIGESAWCEIDDQDDLDRAHLLFK
ncbi:MAG: phosphocholine cytidylyltransferase family protein [Deltaproteobacteria bacterium]|nr:phosphocholine cytidylyltransferase family protein [Deltaproteobacteria bacterium]